MNYRIFAIPIFVIAVTTTLLFTTDQKFTGKQISALSESAAASLISTPVGVTASETIGDDNIVYVAKIKYSKEGLSLVDIWLVEGEPPDRRIQPEDGYTAKLVSSTGDILDFFKFGIPIFLTDIAVELDETYFSVVFPYFPNAKSIQILDPEGNLKLTIDVSQFSRTQDPGPKTVGSGGGGTVNLCLPLEGKQLTGNIIQDVSGNNIRGILKDGLDTTASDETGEKLKGNKMEFDGLDDSIQIPYSPNLAFDQSTTFTISAAAYITETEATGIPQTIVAKPSAQNNMYPSVSLGLDAQNKPVFAISAGDSSSLVYMPAEKPLQPNTPTQITGIYDNGIMKLYVNDKLQGSAMITPAPLPPYTPPKTEDSRPKTPMPTYTMPSMYIPTATPKTGDTRPKTSAPAGMPLTGVAIAYPAAGGVMPSPTATPTYSPAPVLPHTPTATTPLPALVLPTFGSTEPPNKNPILIGGSLVAGSTNFQGMISNVAITATALELPEIKNIVDSGCAGIVPTPAPVPGGIPECGDGTCEGTEISTCPEDCVVPTKTQDPGQKTCTPRPACLDSIPACYLPIPAEGWCPKETTTPTPKCSKGTGLYNCPDLQSCMEAGGMWCGDTATVKCDLYCPQSIPPQWRPPSI